MRKKILLNAIILMTLVAAVGVNVYVRGKRRVASFEVSELKSIVAEAGSFKKKEAPFLYYEVYRQGVLTGYCFNTRDIAPDKKGYAGPIEILVAIDREAKIKNLKVLRHAESPQYADKITCPGFLNQFKGKGPEEAFIVGRDIDAVTRATISSRAAADTLKTSLGRIESVMHGIEKPRPRIETLNLDKDFYITVSLITLLLAAFYLRAIWMRRIGLAASIVYFGFIKANFISMSNLGSIFLWNLPDLRSNLSWFIFIFSGIILTFFLGGFYCSYMCPFDGLQIFLGRIFKYKISVTPLVANRLRRVRFFLLWVLSILVLALNDPVVADYEPFSTVFLRTGSLAAWAAVFIILGLSLFHHRPFCRYFCASGALLDIVARSGRRFFRKG